MDIVGYVFLGILAVLVLFGLVFVVSSMPDIARYLRIRKM
jgi:hypothetical protein